MINNSKPFKTMKMKSWYLFIVVFLLLACNDNDEEKEYTVINIEKSYHYEYESHLTENVDSVYFEQFKQKIYLINSSTQFKKNPLYNYCSDALKENLIKSDFDNYTLILASSSFIQEVTDIKYSLRYNNYNSEYEYFQTNYSKPLVEPVEYLYFVLNTFYVKKLPDDVKIIFIRSQISI